MLPLERAKNNSARSDCSQDSQSEASSNEYVKFDDQELANLPNADFLAQFGSRVANDALDSVLEGNLVSVIGNFRELLHKIRANRRLRRSFNKQLSFSIIWCIE
jgi:hypothetical protein